MRFVPTVTHRLFESLFNSKTDNKHYHSSATPAHRRSDRLAQSPKTEPQSAAKTHRPAGNSPTDPRPPSSPPDRNSARSWSVPHLASSTPRIAALAQTPNYTNDRRRQSHRTAFPPSSHCGIDNKAPIGSTLALRSQWEPRPNPANPIAQAISSYRPHSLLIPLSRPSSKARRFSQIAINQIAINQIETKPRSAQNIALS
jgi:hypothetical protein